MAANKKPLLSIGIIIKDEIRCIERCLSALTPLREALDCELVIADTGSTDGSREIASKYADLLFDFQWVDDFAAARNAVIDRCSGSWFLSVDADEYLDPDISEIVAYFKGKEILNKNTGFINIRNYSRLDMTKGDYVDFNAHRLLKLSTGIRYEGIIHERFIFSKTVPKAFFLLKTIFHHDGYARTTKEEVAKMHLKSDRNMELLRKKVEETPDDMSYIQCIESCRDSKEQLRFAQQAMKIARARNFTSIGDDNDNIMNVMLCRAVSVLLIACDKTAEDELSFLSERLTNFLMFNVDVSFAAIAYYQKKKEWERVIHYADIFEKSFEIYQKDGGRSYEFIISPAFYGYARNKQQSYIFKIEALIRLGREEEALSLFETVDFKLICEVKEDIGMSLRLLIDLCKQPKAAIIFEKLNAEVLNLDENFDIAKSIISGFFINAIKTHKENESYRLLLATEGLYSFCAKILATNDPAEIEQLLAEYNSVADLPAQILYKIIEVTNKLPQSFYNAPSSYHLAAAYNLNTLPLFHSLLIEFIKKNNFHGDLAKTNFVYHSLASALQKGGYDDSDWDILCKMFLMFSESIIRKIYSEELLSRRELWNLCIANHHISLILMKVKDLVLSGDEISVITTLRSALDVSTTTKDLVSYLIDNAARLFSAPPAELISLADKLRTMLAIYEDNDPFAIEIKNSDAYKQIAHLVELPTKEELGL